MQLEWVHNQVEGNLTCTINSELQYVTYNGGGTIIKYFQGDTFEIDGNKEWDTEKHWISDNFSQQLGKYEPQWGITEESWQAEHPEWKGALPIFGLTTTGEYIDKLGRTASFQEGCDMIAVVVDFDRKLMIEHDETGKFYRRLWCDYNNTFYNVQPCCVFPDNPGRQQLTQDEAEQLLGKPLN